MGITLQTLSDGSVRVVRRERLTGWQDRVERFLKNRVNEGLVVTAQATPNTTVSVSAGVIYLNNIRYDITAGTVGCGGADASLGRIDIIEVDNTGIYFKLGTAAATAYAPDPTDGRIVLAEITRAAGDNAIGAADISNDARPKLFNDNNSVG